MRATADAAEDAGETAGETAAAPAEAKTPNRGSPLFSPVGGVAVAFAAAALMPRVGDRSATVVDFVERRVRPMIEEVEATVSVETQLEMINCARPLGEVGGGAQQDTTPPPPPRGVERGGMGNGRSERKGRRESVR